MFVNIILVASDQANQIKKTLESIFNQDFADFMVTIIDNASKDHTQDIIKAITDSRVRIISLQKKHSWKEMLHLGVQSTESNYVTWITPSTVVTKKWLLELTNKIKNHPSASCALSYHANTDKNLNVLSVNKEQRFDFPGLFFLPNQNISFIMRTPDLIKSLESKDIIAELAVEEIWLKICENTKACLVKKVLCYHYQNSEARAEFLDNNRNLYRELIERFLARTGGLFVIDFIYPVISLCKNSNFERFKSILNFASLAYSTDKYCPSNAIVDLLLRAIDISYDEKIVINIAHIYVKNELWDKAKIAVQEFNKSRYSDELSNLLICLEEKNKTRLNDFPFTVMPDSFLAKDCSEEISEQFEIVRNFTNSKETQWDTNPGLYAQIATEIIHHLNINENSTAVWRSLTKLNSKQEAFRLNKLLVYTNSLIQVPQDPKVIYLLRVLNAFLEANLENLDSGKNKLNRLIQDHPDSQIAKSALMGLQREKEAVS